MNLEFHQINHYIYFCICFHVTKRLVNVSVRKQDLLTTDQHPQQMYINLATLKSAICFTLAKALPQFVHYSSCYSGFDIGYNCPHAFHGFTPL